MLLALFTTAWDLTGRQRFLLMLPLCLSIAIVYKTLRTPDLRRVPAGVLRLWGTILGGMWLVGFGAWLLFQIMM